MRSLYDLSSVSKPFDPSHRFETSYLVSAPLLAGYRLLVSIYAFTTIFLRYGHEPDEIGRSFSYFTNITFWALAFYFLFAGFHTLVFARTGRAPLGRWRPWLQFLHGLFYSTVVTYPFLVTAVYWALLAPDSWYPKTYDAWENISVHALNSLFALLEILLPRTLPLPWIHIPFLILFLAGYLGVAYITKATQGFYTYSFLDPNKDGDGVVAAYSIGIAVGICVVFCVVWGVLRLKVWVWETKLGRGEERYLEKRLPVTERGEGEERKRMVGEGEGEAGEGEGDGRV
ncbi:hypothetical protein DFH27DRAFT_518514 [Peziza echinospora]|nr:hypothetical protein DFH27DRAFT_518514 [Peziza echinospora]